MHTEAWDTDAFTQKNIDQILCMIQSLHKVLPSTTVYCKACTKHVPVLLCATRLAQSTSQYYFVLQSLCKAIPSTTLYCKDCTKYFPALLWTTMLAQICPSSTLYCKACTEYFPVLLCITKLAQSMSTVLLRTTKIAQSMSQYYFVLQNLHKVRPTTTSYYKACTKYFPVLLRTTKLAQSTSQYYFVLQACRKYFPVLLRTTKLAQSTSQYYFVLQSLHKARPTTQLTQNTFHLLTYHYRSLDVAIPIRFTTSSCKRHYARSPPSNAICTDWIAKHTRTTSNSVRNCSSKTGSRRQSKKNTILKHFLKRILKGQSPAPKWRENLLPNHYRSLDAATPIRSMISSCKKTIVLRTQRRRQTTWTQPLHCVLQHHVANTNLSTRMATEHDNNHAAITLRSATRESRNAKNYADMNNHSLQNIGGTDSTLKPPQPHPPHTRRTFHRRLQPLHTKKYKVSCSGFLPKLNPVQHSCSHYNAFCSITWPTRISLRAWQQNTTTIIDHAAITLRSATRESRNAKNYTQTWTTTRCRT